MPQTGATRYQKFLKSEKAKTKLKAKKDLPKGTNVTKTNFKVKKIVVQEQLKKHGDNEALSTRKLNLNELLSRLNHFNTHSRTNALEGIRELLTQHPKTLEQNLGQLIYGVTPLMLNIEKVVRRDTLKVLHTMLLNIDLDKVDPFYGIMSTYLRSAMTHIDNRIQEDSLLFLDVLLICTPKKVVQDFHRIIPNFLDMISKLRIDSKPGRTLTVNLGSHITTVKWRVKVLHRLKDYLNKFVKYENILDNNTQCTNVTKLFNVNKQNYYPLFNSNYTAVCHVPCFSSKNSLDEIPTDEVEKFNNYINTLMSLLFETWFEACPNVTSEKNMETVVSEDAASLLKHILEVITLLWHIVQHLNKKNPTANIKAMFCQKYKQSYSQHFVKSFPFVTNTRSKQRNENSVFENVITDPKLVTENLEICHLFILLNPVINIKSQNRDIISVINYVEKTFNQNNQDNTNEVILKILHTIFSNEVISWTKTLIVMDSIFKKIIWAYFNKTMSSSFKHQLFNLLCKISLNENLKHFHLSDAYETWLQNLPDILLEESITVQTIDIIHKFAVQNNKRFNFIIQPKLLKIIENLPKIVIVDAMNDTTSYHKLFALLYWIKSWDDKSLNLMEKQLMDSVFKSDHGHYIFDTLKLRA